MKDHDVPQDPGAVYEGQLRRVTYAVGPDGAYAGVPSTGWEAEIGATSVSIDRTNERIREAWRGVSDGALSPRVYHMAVNHHDPSSLAIEMGTWACRVRRHRGSQAWKGLSNTWQARYAEALGLSLEELDQLPESPLQYAGGAGE